MVRAMADAALARATALGASRAEFRLSRRSRLDIRVRDARLEGSDSHTEVGYGLRVVAAGTWGFAAGTRPGTGAAGAAPRRAPCGP
jgi:TldD protein